MSIVFEKSREGSVYKVTALEDGNVIGSAEAISDGHEWSKITKVFALEDKNTSEVKKELLKQLGKELAGQHIFTLADPDEFSIYEGLGYLRSKTSFTYIGNYTKEELNALEADGLFLPEKYRFETEFYPRKPFIDNGSIVKKQNVGEIRYVETLEGASIAEVNDVLSRAFGGRERDAKTTEEVFSTSQKVEVAYEGDKIIGMARAVTDGKSEALILNVAVDPAYQGYQIGWNVVTKLAAQLPGYFIFLNTHPGAVGFYNRKGFRRNKTAFGLSPNPMPPEVLAGFHLPAGYRFPDEYEA